MVDVNANVRLSDGWHQTGAYRRQETRARQCSTPSNHAQLVHPSYISAASALLGGIWVPSQSGGLQTLKETLSQIALGRYNNLIISYPRLESSPLNQVQTHHGHRKATYF
jgi:hypothetical protein